MPGSSPARSPSARLRWLTAAIFVLAAAGAILWWRGCRRYPPVSSKESLQLMRLLYSACSARDPSRLARVEQGMEQLSRDGKLTPAEREAFEKIIGLAKSGQWEKAEREAYRMAQDQVGTGHPVRDHDQQNK